MYNPEESRRKNNHATRIDHVIFGHVAMGWVNKSRFMLYFIPNNCDTYNL